MKAWLMQYLGWVLVAAALAIAVGGFWVGKRWQAAGETRRELNTARADVDALDAALDDFHQAVDDAGAAIERTTRDLQAVTDRLQVQLQEQQRHAESIRLATRHALDARPDLERVRIGPDLLQLWNAANAGRSAAATDPAADPAATSGAADPGAVRAPAAGAQRPDTGADRQPPARGGALPPLRGEAGSGARGRQDARAVRTGPSEIDPRRLGLILSIKALGLNLAPTETCVSVQRTANA